MRIECPSFAAGAEIPARHTCDGPDLSPPLAISDVPPGTASLALVCDDPDAPAGAWTHWVLFDLAPGTRSLPEGLPKNQFVLDNAAQGLNDFGRLGWGGPCPPPGPAHRYFFRLLALKRPLGLGPGASKRAVLEAAEANILARAELMGRYGRKR